MKMHILALSVFALVFSDMDAAAQQASTLSSSNSTVTYTLDPGTVGYSGWAAWVAQTIRSSPGPHIQDGQIGQISIQVNRRTFYSGPLDRSAEGQLFKPADSAYPPTPLPPTGAPGETISIEVKSGSSIERWVYAWTGGGNGNGGGWQLIEHVWGGCVTSKDAGKICPSMVD